MKAVDVIVPCYNYGRYLDACVTSILEQRGVEVRAFVIDDGSSDDTAAVGRGLVERDGRVTFRRHDRNLGHIATYNEGLAWATAEFSMLLSSDDLLTPGALARATGLMSRHPEVGMTYGMALVIVGDEPLPVLAEPVPDDERVVAGQAFLDHCIQVPANPVPAPTAVVRTSVQQQLGGYRSDYPHAGDLEMWLRFAAHSPVGVLRAVQAFYRGHPANMSHGYFGQLLGDLPEVAQVFADVIERDAPDRATASAWSASVRRNLARLTIASASREFNDGHDREYRARLRYAAELWPGRWSSWAWWKLAAKRIVGPRLWSHVAPLANLLRGLPPDQATLPLMTRGLRLGWWPGPGSDTPGATTD